MTLWSDGADLNQISRWCQPEKSKRDHLAPRSFRRRVRAVSRESVQSARSGFGPCRSAKDRSRRASEHAALTHHVQPEAAGGRGQPACGRCQRAAGWPCSPHIFRHRARHRRAQGADFSGDRFRAGLAACRDRRRSRQGSRFHFSRTAPSENSPENRCCSRSAFRSSSFMSRRPTTSCAMPVSILPRRIFWGRRDDAKGHI
jgi:hypothetical protein